MKKILSFKNGCGFEFAFSFLYILKCECAYLYDQILREIFSNIERAADFDSYSRQ